MATLERSRAGSAGRASHQATDGDPQPAYDPGAESPSPHPRSLQANRRGAPPPPPPSVRRRGQEVVGAPLWGALRGFLDSALSAIATALDEKSSTPECLVPTPTKPSCSSTRE